MKKILIIDNYDSFTYNLVQYVREITGKDPAVYRNDTFDLDQAGSFSTIILSPGPGLPVDAGSLEEVIRRYGPEKEILGICLGQQAIAEVYGGSLINLKKVYHGVATNIRVVVDDEPLFKGLPKEFKGGRYHSWVVDPDSFPAVLEITAVDEEGQIMALRHREYRISGLQFHPESVLTPVGEQILLNFLNPV